MRRGPCSSDRRRRPAACAASIATRRSSDAMVGATLARAPLTTNAPSRSMNGGHGGSAPPRTAAPRRARAAAAAPGADPAPEPPRPPPGPPEARGRPEVLARLGERFGLHPMALEDAMNVPQRPKVERFDTYFLIVLRMVRLSQEVEDEQVSLFFGQDWVVPGQERADWVVFPPVRVSIRHRCERFRDADADYLAYLLLD